MTPSPSPSIQMRMGAISTKKIASHHRRNKHDLHVEHPYHDHSYDRPTEEKHITRGGVTEPFPLKLHRLLDQIASDGFESVVGWQRHGRCFVVHKPKEFVEDVMPKYFKQTKFASFQRQLNLYGFSRLTAGLDRGGYYHELFLCGKPFLAHRIHRMRVKGTRVRMASSPDREPNFYAMPPLCAGQGPCSVRGCCNVQHHMPPTVQGQYPPPPPVAGPVLARPGMPPMMAQACQPLPQHQACQPLPQHQYPPQQAPLTPPMTSTRYGPPPPPISQLRASLVSSPPPVASAPAMAQAEERKAQEQRPPATAMKQVYTMVTPINARPSLSRDQLQDRSPAPQTQMAARRNELPQPVRCSEPPQQPMQQPTHQPPSPQQMGAVVENNEDIDEVVFEGKTFHYLKPFKEASSLPPSPQRQLRQPVVSFRSAPPALPESVPSFDADDARLRQPQLVPPYSSEPVIQQQRPTVVPGSPPLSTPHSSTRSEVPTLQPPQTFGRPLPPPPSLDIPSAESMFETASRLAEIVYKKEPAAKDPKTEQATSSSNADLETRKPEQDSTASGAKFEGGKTSLVNNPNNFKVNINVDCQDGDVKLRMDVVRSSSVLPPVSDDEQQGISHSSSETDFSRNRNDAGCSAAATCSSFDNKTSLAPLVDDKISSEMEDFFATLDSPLELDEEMNEYLTDDTNFGYMIEKVLE